MVKKSIEKLREKAPYVLKRKGHAKQRKKLLKAYQGKRLKQFWAAYASWECCTIAELKKQMHDLALNLWMYQDRPSTR